MRRMRRGVPAGDRDADGPAVPGRGPGGSGVRAGDAISPWYDPMIAKLIAHGPTREIALGRLAQGLEATRVAGCMTNLGFLARLVRHADFAAGRVDTGLIERDLAALTRRGRPSAEVRAVAALAAGGLLDRAAADGVQALGAAGAEPVAGGGGEGPRSRVETLGPGRFRVDGRAGGGGWEEGELAVTADGRGAPVRGGGGRGR